MEKHVENFGGAAQSYEHSGELQNYVAARLAEQLPDFRKPRLSILEIGCGTGFLTGHLRNKFGNAASYIITDAAPEMVESCKASFSHAAHMQFMPMDGQKITLPKESMDLIASSMAFQWFDDPARTIQDLQRHLRPGGSLHYATIGHENFAEWREHLSFCGLDFGMKDLPETYPGQYREEFIPRDYKSGRGFVDMLKDTGASTPKPGYQRPSPKQLYQAVDSFDGDITWHIVYGRLDMA